MSGGKTQEGHRIWHMPASLIPPLGLICPLSVLLHPETPLPSSLHCMEQLLPALVVAAPDLPPEGQYNFPPVQQNFRIVHQN